MDALIVYLFIEIVSNFTIFPLLNKGYGMKKHEGEIMNPRIKGVIERLCLVIGMSIAVPHVLVAYGALKIGTKLGGQPRNTSDKTKTEYYLIGNLISIIIAFLIVYLSDKIPMTGIKFCDIISFLTC